MSRQIIVCMPCRFSCEMLLPVCGRAIMTTIRAMATISSQNLMAGRRREMPGESVLSRVGLPRSAMRFRWLRRPMMRIATSAGTSSNSQRYVGSSNLNMISYFLISHTGRRLSHVSLSSTSTSSRTRAAMAKGM